MSYSNTINTPEDQGTSCLSNRESECEEKLKGLLHLKILVSIFSASKQCKCGNSLVMKAALSWLRFSGLSTR